MNKYTLILALFHIINVHSAATVDTPSDEKESLRAAHLIYNSFKKAGLRSDSGASSTFFIVRDFRCNDLSETSATNTCSAYDKLSKKRIENLKLPKFQEILKRVAPRAIVPGTSAAGADVFFVNYMRCQISHLDDTYDCSTLVHF